jgi:glutathione S-transferase
LASWATILFRGKTEEEKSEGKKALSAVLDTLEGALAKCSDGKGFFGGDSIGLVDLVLGSHLSWLKATEVMSGEKIFGCDKIPLLTAWMENFTELDAAKATLPEVDKVVEYAKMLQARQAAAAAAASNN